VNSSEKASHRIYEIDALRGIALLGILLVNIFIFHAPYAYYGEFYGAFKGTQGMAVEAVVNFAGGKFLFIFAFLFGYGIAMQKQKNGAAFGSYHSKRMLVLLLFGIFHIVFFWFGDILASYALLGFLLLPIARLSDRAILILGIFFIFFRSVFYFIMVGFSWSMIDLGIPAELDQFITTFQSGTWKEIFVLRMKEFYTFTPENLVWFIPKTLGLFLVGFYCRNRKLVQYLKYNRIKALVLFILLMLLSVIWISIKLDFFSQFDLEANPIMRPVLIGVNVFFETAQGIGYIIGFLLLFQNSRIISKLFEATGRLALTNYIIQSLICVLLFYSYGLGLYTQLQPTDLIWISIAIYAFNIVFSHLYLKYYTYGPIEYLWRKMIAGSSFNQQKS
jgi:uncharacterized protein